MKRQFIFKGILLLVFLGFYFIELKAQSEEIVHIQSGDLTIEGTLLVPETQVKVPVALIIAGSGPTDRDGNNPIMKNNCLKMLAEGLYQNQIATLRFDKRMIGKSTNSTLKESDLRFDDYINDAIEWVNFLRNSNRFSEIIIIGHSEGSLIGMIASARSNVEKYISIAGASEPIGEIIKKQLSSQPPIVLENSLPIIDSLAQGELVKNVPAFLNSLFRASVQPYMISWMKYNPQVEISKLDIPVLIVLGTNDIQVDVENAEKLKEANKSAELVIIDGMNHIFKDAEQDKQKNLGTYYQPDLPINTKFLSSIVDFIQK